MVSSSEVPSSLRSILSLMTLTLMSQAHAQAASAMCDERLFFHQLLAGRDVAVPEKALGSDQQRVFSMAKSMQNFMYLIGDTETREAIAIDAVYDPEGVVAVAESFGYNVTSALGTHFHYDHIGHLGAIPGGPGIVLPGLRHFVHDRKLPGFIHETELAVSAQQIGVAPESLTPLHDGEVLRIGSSIKLRVIHTPGHSPGGITIVVSVDGAENDERFVITGDTLFPGSCGRLDLPGSSVDAMYDSLQHRLRGLHGELTLFPGHAYSGASSTVARERETGLLRPMTKVQWRRMMAR